MLHGSNGSNGSKQIGKTRCTICRIGMVDRRRTRVVERPCGLDVSGVNALSVPEFLSHELGNDSRETADFGW